MDKMKTNKDLEKDEKRKKIEEKFEEPNLPKKKSQMDTSVWLCGPPPACGQKQRYPSRFLFNLKKFYPFENKKVLTMFSGSSEIGDTTDIRPETGAKFVGPYDKLPIEDETYDMVVADPPYNALYASEWSANLPKPKRILKEAARVTNVGGYILILHIIIVPAYKELNVKRVALHPILTGPNNAIRVLNVFKKIK